MYWLVNISLNIGIISLKVIKNRHETKAYHRKIYLVHCVFWLVDCYIDSYSRVTILSCDSHLHKLPDISQKMEASVAHTADISHSPLCFHHFAHTGYLQGVDSWIYFISLQVSPLGKGLSERLTITCSFFQYVCRVNNNLYNAPCKNYWVLLIVLYLLSISKLLLRGSPFKKGKCVHYSD